MKKFRFWGITGKNKNVRITLIYIYIFIDTRTKKKYTSAGTDSSKTKSSIKSKRSRFPNEKMSRHTSRNPNLKSDPELKQMLGSTQEKSRYKNLGSSLVIIVFF